MNGAISVVMSSGSRPLSACGYSQASQKTMSTSERERWPEVIGYEVWMLGETFKITVQA